MRLLVATLALVFGLVSAPKAQTVQKFGHINSSELLQAMPESAEIQKQLEEYARQLETQLKTMSTEYQSKVAAYQENENVWTGLVKESKLKEISDLETRIGEFRQTAQSSLAEREQELFQPLLDKAQKAITDVANANGYTYVFDTSTGSLVHFPDSDDILGLVKSHLGIQ